MEGIYSLSFPYNQSENDNVVLNKLILTDENDLQRYTFDVEEVNHQRKCTMINIIDTVLQNKLDKPLSYIDNSSETRLTPLLIRCDANFKKIKLRLSIKYHNLKQSLVIVKTKGVNKNGIDAISELKTYLESNKMDNERYEISQISYSKLPLNANISEYQKIIINDGFNNEIINDDILNIYLFETDGSTYNHLFDFKLWIDKFIRSNPLKPDSNVIKSNHTDQQDIGDLQISDYRNAFNFRLDDGPEFRKVLHNYEQRIPSIQKNIAVLIDEIKNMENCFKRLTNSKMKIIDIVNSLSNLNPILSKFNFRNEFQSRLDAIFKPFETNLKYFLNDICNKKILDKMKSVSNSEDEQHNNELNSMKKNFESQSKDYYNWLKKYLSNEKERPELKLLIKRKNFELSKFDYLNCLNNFSNNQYMNELFENLFKFINRTGSNRNNELNDHYKIYLTVLLKFNAEKFKLRQMIETCKTNNELTNLIRDNNLTIKPDFDINDDKIVTTDNVGLIFSPIEAPESEYDELNSQYEKSGILYALGGKGKQGWHKEWVVLNDGELREYSDWRTGNAPINKPIPIALTSVKPTVHDKRQHCFEIITSTNSKFVFQALNESEKNEWIKALTNSRHLANTGKLQENFKNDNANNTNNVNKSKKLHLKFDRPTTITTNQSDIISPVSVQSSNIITKNYLKQVRSIPNSGNHICADCNSTEDVEWISMNFLNVICINCSSCHRSMGTHVSKIKSLKLDNFEKESEVLLSYVNNNLHNSYLEANLKLDKSTKLTNYESRLEFIQDKYINKKFIDKIDNINDLLTRSVQKIHIEEVIKSISMGADCNLKLQILVNKTEHQTISLFEYSLRKYIIVENEGDKLHHMEKYFVISELLLLNGVKISKVNKELDLTDEAFQFWEQKYSKLI